MKKDIIERDIVTGFIVSTDYLNVIHNIYVSKFIQSDIARKLAEWCMEYYHKFAKAPQANLEQIYLDKLQGEEITKDEGEFIEIVLEGLSDDFQQSDLNIDYLIERTLNYFKERKVQLKVDNVKQKLDNGDIEDAEKDLMSYSKIEIEEKDELDIFSRDSLEVIREAFEEHHTPLMNFKGAVGEFWNHHLVEGGFVCLLGPEKRGKSQYLMEFVMQSLKDGNDTVFFQAGDMTTKQMIRRIGVYLCKNSDMEKYCTSMYVPVPDCMYNQLDTCEQSVRECNHGICMNIEEVSDFNALIAAHNDFPEYVPCTNCPNMIGKPYVEKVERTKPITWKDAYKAFLDFKTKYDSKFKLSTHPAETLHPQKIKQLLDTWKKEEDFSPKVIILDYMGLLSSDYDCLQYSFRDQQNKIWMRVRGIAQKYNCLIVSADQADSDSYERDLITMRNFSEDKRKLSHVSAMFGLNQTANEKQIGLMRINDVVIREGRSDNLKPVTVLQRLEKGQPLLDSYL